MHFRCNQNISFYMCVSDKQFIINSQNKFIELPVCINSFKFCFNITIYKDFVSFNIHAMEKRSVKKRSTMCIKLLNYISFSFLE